MSPFRELQQLEQEKKVIQISPISPVQQPLSETSSRNELREKKLTAETEELVTSVRAGSTDDRQWKEMKLRLDDLPGILARLSKIKLTGMFFSFCASCLTSEFFSLSQLLLCMFLCDNSCFTDTK